MNKGESRGLKDFNDSKAFIEYSNDMDDIYKNIEENNPNKKPKILITFVYMIADMLNNKKLNQVATELFIRSRKQNISLVFISQSYFAVPKILLNSMHYFIMKIPKQTELQQIAFNHSSDIDFKKFYMNLYKKFTVKPLSFLVIDTTLAVDNPSHFRKNLVQRI